MYARMHIYLFLSYAFLYTHVTLTLSQTPLYSQACAHTPEVENEKSISS